MSKDKMRHLTIEERQNVDREMALSALARVSRSGKGSQLEDVAFNADPEDRERFRHALDPQSYVEQAPEPDYSLTGLILATLPYLFVGSVIISIAMVWIYTA